MVDITEEEVLSTINSAPNNKAPDPTGIQYEILKHLPLKMITTLINIYNQILRNGTTPTI